MPVVSDGYYGSCTIWEALGGKKASHKVKEWELNGVPNCSDGFIRLICLDKHYWKMDVNKISEGRGSDPFLAGDSWEQESENTIRLNIVAFNV